jgi:hypothetical protein
MIEHTYKAQELSDGELIDEIVNKVWGELESMTWESTLVDEMIQRLMRYSGLTETPQGVLRDDGKRW